VKELHEEQEIIRDLAEQGRSVLDSAGVPIPARKTGQGSNRTPQTPRVEDGLEQVANDPNSPYRGEARRILDLIRQRKERLRHLNGLLDPAQRDRI
jgi:hypothetical protein